MKKLLWIALAWAVMVSGARAADLSPPRVTVYGEAEEMVAPDRIVWYLNVTNKGADLKDVAEKHTRIVADVLSLLKQPGIESDSVQTSGMRFGENWDYRNSSRVKEGYFASTDIMFKLSEMDKYGYFWMKFSEVNDLSIGNVTYAISDNKRYDHELRKKALLAAKEKARGMAEILGAEIGEPLAIEEDIPAAVRPIAAARMLQAEGMAHGGEQAVAPGKITLQDRVKVIFRLNDTAK